MLSRSHSWLYLKGCGCWERVLSAVRDQVSASYDEMTGLVDEGKVVDIVCFDLSKAFQHVISS